MPFSDLREFVSKLDEAGELAHVRKEVEPKYEVGAICKTIHDKGRQEVKKNWGTLFYQLRLPTRPSAQVPCRTADS